MLTKTPIPNVNANPLTNPVAKMNRMIHVIIVEIFPSRIAGQALLNPSSILPPKLLPDLNSSLKRSKIRTFASTAIPIDKINPAIPANVKITEINLKIAKTKITYITKAKLAIRPGRR